MESFTVYKADDSTRRCVASRKGPRSKWELSFQYTDGKGFWYCNLFGGFSKTAFTRESDVRNYLAGCHETGYFDAAAIASPAIMGSVGVS